MRTLSLLTGTVIASLICNVQSASLDDIEHIVIFMQENRAFDHYYGNMKGVRGFNDRASPLLPNGATPFFQPLNGKGNDTYMLPFPLSFKTTSATCMGAPTMSYNCDIAMWNNGKMDGWATARSPGFGMSYFNRDDLPFYYALADNYLIGDNYFQSTFTATNPNRLMLFSGSNGLSVNNTHVILDDSEPSGINWITVAEVLQNAGITWRVYQEANNFDDNGFAWFDNFKAAKPGSPLYDNGMYRSADLYTEFANAVNNGSLPQVSWIVGPSELSEHATNHPQDGEDLSARLIKIFGEPGNADIYSKTVFIQNYDEGGQFYDHMWVPTAPMSAADGASTVTTEGEVTKKTNFNVPPGNPIGPGFRVPFWIISPFTRKDGGIVFSELSDHTSVIQFIEKRFKVTVPNISPWRRAVMSDLLYAFDFENPDYTFPGNLPDTSNNTAESHEECDDNPSPKVPAIQYVPTQEEGTKTSRALPYSFNITDTVDTSKKTVTLTMKNIGDAGVVFHVFDYIKPAAGPQKYTIEPAKELSGVFKFDGNSYNLSLHGPNGYVRSFASSNAEAESYQIQMNEYGNEESIAFEIDCLLGSSCGNQLVIEDLAYGNEREIVREGGVVKKNVESSGNWYDYMITEINEDSGGIVFERRFMGHVENGKDSITDPAMAVPIIDNERNHPDIKFYFDSVISVKWKDQVCNRDYFAKNGFVKDVCWN